VLSLDARCFRLGLLEAPSHEAKIQIEKVCAELQLNRAFAPAPRDSPRRVASRICLVADGRFLRDHSRTTAGLRISWASASYWPSSAMDWLRSPSRYSRWHPQ